MRYYFCAFFLLASSASIFSMEIERGDLSLEPFKRFLETPVILDKEGRWDLFPQTDIDKFHVLKDCLETSENVGIVSLEKGTLGTFRTCLECLNNPYRIEDLVPEDLSSVFQLAHYYDASSEPHAESGSEAYQKFCRQLAVRAYHSLPKTEVTDEMKQYIVSINSILNSDDYLDRKKNFVRVFNAETSSEFRVLDLRKMNINCLDGLRDLANDIRKKGQNIYAINFKKNHLEEVDLDLLFTLFPTVKHVNLSKNPLKRLKMMRIPDKYWVVVNDTHLKALDEFLPGYWSCLSLRKNRFSLENQTKVESYFTKKPYKSWKAILEVEGNYASLEFFFGIIGSPILGFAGGLVGFDFWNKKGLVGGAVVGTLIIPLIIQASLLKPLIHYYRCNKKECREGMCAYHAGNRVVFGEMKNQ